VLQQAMKESAVCSIIELLPYISCTQSGTSEWFNRCG